jgi:hypothetical protein
MKNDIIKVIMHIAILCLVNWYIIIKRNLVIINNTSVDEVKEAFNLSYITPNSKKVIFISINRMNNIIAQKVLIIIIPICKLSLHFILLLFIKYPLLSQLKILNNIFKNGIHSIVLYLIMWSNISNNFFGLIDEIDNLCIPKNINKKISMVYKNKY